MRCSWAEKTESLGVSLKFLKHRLLEERMPRNKRRTAPPGRSIRSGHVATKSPWLRKGPGPRLSGGPGYIMATPCRGCDSWARFSLSLSLAMSEFAQ